MRLHIEGLTNNYIASGMTREDARNVAIKRFGGVAKMKRQCRDARGFAWLERLIADARFAARFLRRTHALAPAVFIIGVLAIGMMAVAVRLSEGIVLRVARHPGFTHSEDSQTPFRTGIQFLAFQEQTNVFAEFGAVEHATSNTVRGSAAAPVTVWNVSNDFFHALGVKPFLGRAFLQGEESGAKDKVVITDVFWRRHFNGAPDVVGRTLVIDQRICTVIGVLASDQPLPPVFKGDIYRLFAFDFDPRKPLKPSA